MIHMTLDKAAPGEGYTVTALSLPEAVEHRLEALGMTIGTKLTVLENKSHGILVVKLRGTRFAVGRGITKRIEVV